ncbi:hypothetical protein BGZ63DRAFT_388518 [Mariannaea sp. PMI_226]|nr:hypothetical protein BGZ63DRAFT_388518 [Mariannaea sp. PMI_226]
MKTPCPIIRRRSALRYILWMQAVSCHLIYAWRGKIARIASTHIEDFGKRKKREKNASWGQGFCQTRRAQLCLLSHHRSMARRPILGLA